MSSRTGSTGPDVDDPEFWIYAPARWADSLERAQQRDGAVPTELQDAVAERLFEALRADTGLYTRTASLPASATDAFHRSLTRIVALLGDDVILRPRAGAGDELRLAVLLGAAGRQGHTRARRRTDAGRGLDRVSWYFAGADPAPQPPAEHHKVRAVDVLGRTLLHEHVAWVPTGVPIELGTVGEVTLPRVSDESGPSRLRRIVAENRGLVSTLMADRAVRRRARTPEAAERYRDAWLLMDRDTAAGDNAEHLYRHLREHEPQVNAWFVLAAGTRDWERLQAEGFRLLEYGSQEHFVALLHCAQVASSQVDSYVVKPFRGHALGPGRWRFTFLQHGVIKDDLSRWLNGKPLDVFVTSTADEQRSIAGDGSPYVFTDLETVLTGLARHDRLLELAADRPGTDLVVMPTWRRELLGPQGAGNRRELLPDFWQSAYARGWREFLEAPRLRALCERAGWRLVFVPHPNMQGYLDTSPLPAHVRALRFDEIDVQQVLADAAVVVTDYSSLASEAAYIRRPVVYHQFDRREFFAGGHVYRRGDWSYEKQGFGPVTDTAFAAIEALEDLVRDGVDPVHAERMERTFAFRDGRCCERTVTAIRAVTGV